MDWDRKWLCSEVLHANAIHADCPDVRNERKIVAQFHVPAFVRERTITCYASVDPEYLAHSSLEISERAFAANEKTRPIPLPGGIDYQIALKSFAPSQSEGGH